MNEEEYMMDDDMLAAFQMQVFINRFEKQKDELLAKSVDEVLDKVLNGVPYEIAVYEAAAKLVDEIWEGNQDET